MPEAGHNVSSLPVLRFRLNCDLRENLSAKDYKLLPVPSDWSHCAVFSSNLAAICLRLRAKFLPGTTSSHLCQVNGAIVQSSLRTWRQSVYSSGPNSCQGLLAPTCAEWMKPLCSLLFKLSGNLSEAQGQIPAMDQLPPVPSELSHCAVFSSNLVAICLRLMAKFLPGTSSHLCQVNGAIVQSSLQTWRQSVRGSGPNSCKGLQAPTCAKWMEPLWSLLFKLGGNLP